MLRTPEGFATRQIVEQINLIPRATRTRFAARMALKLVREIGTGPQNPRRREYSTAA